MIVCVLTYSSQYSNVAAPPLALSFIPHPSPNSAYVKKYRGSIILLSAEETGEEGKKQKTKNFKSGTSAQKRESEGSKTLQHLTERQFSYACGRSTGKFLPLFDDYQERGGVYVCY